MKGSDFFKKNQIINMHHLFLMMYFQPVLKDEWEGSFNSWVEYAMTCYIHITCDDCPFIAEEDKGKGFKPSGIGRNSNE